MPWDNNTGGGGRNNNSGGPWGQAPQGGGGGGPRRGNTPSLEDILKGGRDRFQGAGFPGGRWAIAGGAVVLIAFWLFNSIYTINEGEVGVELQFGKPKPELSQPGLHFHWWPVEDVERVSIAVRQTTIGSSTGNRNGSGNEGLMLSGDQNIVDVRFAVQWAVANPVFFLFNVRDPEDMVRSAAESAMREVVGRRPAQDAFRNDQAGIAAEVQRITQAILESYETGVSINDINIEVAAPPAEVVDAFEEVQRAEQDETRFQEEARRDANTLLGNARGQAAQLREDAAAYKNRVVQEAEGEAARFVSIYNEYARAPEVTRKRLFLETMEQVLGSSEKVIVEPGTTGSGVVPYLPLNQLQSGTTTSPTTSATGN
ncbi:MAG: FtsH protease activity modulator HflK [Devosia sp.]|uniref:FtsH protease activity modulator HflK n=1 Tax=unclassified Devosia TaxID=196773 RepID=UPI00092A1E97|nr:MULTISPECIES: FtsH protease activity modulator HflK [unclassified Devosia]MBL8597699.1 FtsH protease activity modulator HflK [Devosia sp.]MBN9345598.1 FtsH protease activity modulator HflK [Devosia sp.]OJX50701.1 MAG: HflK protein [Devosia sp. 66-22]